MIYHVLPELEPLSASRGGALAHTVANILRLDKSRIAVCPDVDDTWGFRPDRVIVVPELRVYARIRGRRFIPIFILAPILRRAYRIMLSRLTPRDIVWFHNRPAFAAALGLTIRSIGAKVVCHLHDGNDVLASQLAFKRFAPDATIFVSDYLRRYWLKLIPSLASTHVVHNGVDETVFFPRESYERLHRDRPVVLFVGRLHPEKGVHVLLNALSILRERGISVSGRIIGSSFSGDSRPSRYIADLLKSSPPNVTFGGFRSARQIAEEYRGADILCCPSIWQEPFGKVNIEAMACALPVVASCVGGIPEIAERGGIALVPPDSPMELADALQTLILNVDLRLKLADEGLSSVRRSFTWRSVLNRYDSIVDQIYSHSYEG